jgi:lipoate-protein ligase A
MALDVALMDRAAESGESVLRIYQWARPTLSLGRNQAARGRYDLQRAAEHGLDFVRRPTGGRALLHHREVTYSVTAPLRVGLSLRESYARINRLLIEGLRRLGVDVRVAAPEGRELPPGDAPCFETPSAGELVLDGRKLVGSAQWRDERALLQHGSILIDDDQALVASLLREPVAAPPPPATLRAAMGRAPDADEVAGAIFDAARTLEDARARPLAVDAALMMAVERARAHFADDAWTWRR